MHRLFDLDWGIASRAHGLAWLITKSSHDPSTWKELDRHGHHASVDAARGMLWEWHSVVYGAFDWLAVLYSDQELSPGE
jgi:hypothetical protein